MKYLSQVVGAANRNHTVGEIKSSTESNPHLLSKNFEMTYCAARLIFCHTPVEFLLGVSAGKAVFLLDQAYELIALGTHCFYAVAGELIPSFFGRVTRLLLLAVEFILAHAAILSGLIEQSRSITLS